MQNQKSVFEFGDEFNCTEFYDTDTNHGGVSVSRSGNHLGEIVGLNIPDIEDEDENIKFDQEVIAWIIDNGH